MSQLIMRYKVGSLLMILVSFVVPAVLRGDDALSKGTRTPPRLKKRHSMKSREQMSRRTPISLLNRRTASYKHCDAMPAAVDHMVRTF